MTDLVKLIRRDTRLVYRRRQRVYVGASPFCVHGWHKPGRLSVTKRGGRVWFHCMDCRSSGGAEDYARETLLGELP